MIAPTLTTEGFSSATDEALMGAITDRDENALAALYQRHGETLRSIIESVIHEQAEAEDVLQETLLQIWKQAQNYAPRVGKPLGWLTTITRRRAIDRLRRRQAYIRVKDRFQEQINELPNGASTTVDGDEEMERADLRRYLRNQMSALPEFQRQALELSFFTGIGQDASRAWTPKIARLAKASATQDLTCRSRHTCGRRMCRGPVRENVGVPASLKIRRSFRSTGRGIPWRVP